MASNEGISISSTKGDIVNILISWKPLSLVDIFAQHQQVFERLLS